MIRPPERSRTVRDFQNIIELSAGEINVDVLAAGDAAEVLEMADAVFVEDDAAHRQFFRRFGSGCARFRLRCGGERRDGLGLRLRG